MADKEKKKVIDRINDWWESANEKNIDKDVKLSRRHASRGQISTHDNGITTTYSGNEDAVRERLTKEEQDNLDNQNGPFLDPDKGPMPARYHRNKQDDFDTDVVGETPLSQSESKTERMIAEDLAEDRAYADRKHWENERRKEEDKRAVRRERLNRWLVGKHNGQI